MPDSTKRPGIQRRQFFRRMFTRAWTLVLGGLGGVTLGRAKRRSWVWQIDPDVCVQCENCATHCVLDESAVKCVQSYPICGYCDLCFGYFRPGAPLNSGAENQLCPTGAIERVFVEEPYWEYNIDERLCIGCAKCVKACEVFGNASFYLQVRHDRCLNCNECSIARDCPSGAFRRVPIDQPYLMRTHIAAPGGSTT